MDNYEKELNSIIGNDVVEINNNTNQVSTDITTFIINNRTINIPPAVTDIVVKGDTNSRIITFELNRYFDGVDLLNKVIAIKYINALNESDRTFAVNVSNTDNKITFGWLIDNKVTKKNGYVRFAIEFLGYLDNGEFYCWSTKPSQIEVSEGLYVDDSIEQSTPSWLQSWQIQADNNLKSMELQLRINDSYVQWKHYNDSDWENLFSLNDIQSGSGVISYSDVTDKPTINSIEVDGAKTANDYNISNGLNIDNSKVTYKNVEKLLSEVLSVITPINELNTESDSPVSTKAIMSMITPVKGDPTGATYLDTNALPANTYRCYMPIDDEVRIKIGANKYRLRQGNTLVVTTSDTQYQFIILSKVGFSLYLHTLSSNIVSVYRTPYINPDEYDAYKSRYCYSDKKVDELLENIRELPAVTTSDNGKILKVVDGVWTAVSLANGDEVSY